MKLTLENTDIYTWFERDRAHVELTFADGCEDTIFELWDEQVSEFIEDGFKRDLESWHQAMVNYANERGLAKAGTPTEFKRGVK